MMAPTPTSPTLAIATLVATAAAIGAFVALHLLPTGLSPVRDAVSHYGIVRYRLGYRVLTVSLGLSGIVAAAGVAIAFPDGGRRATAVTLLVIFGLSRALISWFPMDAPRAARTQQGTVHVVLAVITFASITYAAFQLHAVVQQADRAGEFSAFAYATTSLATSWLLLVAVVGTVLTSRVPELRPWFGAVERLIYLGTFILLVSTGIELL